ncbi:MAG: hypothetical protein JO057_05115 [Chloroflexi bacterium]|nr:hypothetical protein [Chloroflexota bacterium]
MVLTWGMAGELLHGAQVDAPVEHVRHQRAPLLAAEKHERRRRVVFIIGEAHLLAPDQLKELVAYGVGATPELVQPRTADGPGPAPRPRASRGAPEDTEC